MTLGTASCKRSAIPVIIDALVQLLYRHLPSAVFSGAQQHTGEDPFCGYEHIAHGSELHTESHDHGQRIVVVDQQVFELPHDVFIHIIRCVILPDIEAGHKIRNHFLQCVPVFRVAIPEPQCPDEHLVNGTGVHKVGICTKRIMQPAPTPRRII